MTTFIEKVKSNSEGGDFKKSEYFKFKEGDNKILILTEPQHFRNAYNVGIVYEGSGYNDIAASKYSCYAVDLNDGRVKLFEFSNTIAKQMVTLSEGHFTKFENYPMPYAINIQAKGAGTKMVKYSVIALEPMAPTIEQVDELASLDTVEEILDRKKAWQKKQMETEGEYKEKAEASIARSRKEKADEKAKREAETVEGELPTVQMEDDVDLEDVDLESIVDSME